MKLKKEHQKAIDTLLNGPFIKLEMASIGSVRDETGRRSFEKRDVYPLVIALMPDQAKAAAAEEKAKKE